MPYSELIIAGIAPGEIEFTSETYGSYNVTRIERWIQESKLLPTKVVLERENLKKLLANIDIDQKRVEELLLDFIETDKLPDKPLIAVEVHDGDPLVIDGHHRMYLNLQLDIFHADIHIVPMDIANSFKIVYMERDPKTGNTRAVDPVKLLLSSFGKYTDSKGNPRQ